MRNTNIPEVQVIFKKWNQILLNLRHNTGYMDHWYGLVAGHVEEGETFTQGAIREAFEEAWVKLKPEQLKYVHTVHRRKVGETMRVWVLFLVEYWDGEIINAEPHKSKELIWCDMLSLPHNTIPYIQTCITNIQQWLSYTETEE
jgi:8-oxo-dGTP diphosphatase